MSAGKKPIAPILLGLGGAAALFLFSRKSHASTGGARKHGVPMRLSRNFQLSEFLTSRDPDLSARLKGVKLTDSELANLKRLVSSILQPVRDEFGPVVITSGLRPLNIMSKQGWVDYLRKRGYHSASLHSDHFDGGGADFVLTGGDDTDYLEAAQLIASLPATRQIILYYKTNAAGETVPQHLHVGVVRSGKPKIRNPESYAFMMKDDKKFPGGTQTLLQE